MDMIHIGADFHFWYWG